MDTLEAVTLAHIIDTQARAAAALLNATAPIAASISVHIAGQGSPILIDLAALGQDPLILHDLSVNIIRGLVANVEHLTELLSAEPWSTFTPPP